MEVKVSDQRIFVFNNLLSFEDAGKKAWENKIIAFGAFSKFGSYLSQPKDEDFELLYKEHRCQPFWHVAAHSRYAYDRNTKYRAKIGGPEVKSVTYNSKDFTPVDGSICFSVTEHCNQEENDEVFIDAIDGNRNPLLPKYLSFSHDEFSDVIDKPVSESMLFVPPQIRVSAIMRNMLSSMIKGIQADDIHEETIEVTTVHLYYHPIFAFKFLWKTKEKEAILEIDGLTGVIRPGKKVFSQYMGKLLERDFLFDIGADIAGMIIPGGTLAVMAAKKCIDIYKERK